ncbi:sulfate transporter family-domain-containing protein [Hysterangium stoloniferum]|nr:sulfate transporter family-domain-containing protein [Hysterangium stoloniferum]
MRVSETSTPPREQPPSSAPSALSILISQSRAASRERDLIHPQDDVSVVEEQPAPPPSSPPIVNGNGHPFSPSETTPLVHKPGVKPTDPVSFSATVAKHKSSPWRDRIHLPSSHTVIHAIPAVILGLLLNILDGVSYGMIVFPATGAFLGFGGTGVSMFFVTTIVAQLVYAMGGSGFGGANGSMMIEVVPFFHILANTIQNEIGESDPRSVVATTMVAFALSSIFTGLAFLSLGFLNLGVLIGFFPRHILVGCIGGVGVFLIETGFEVAAGLDGDSFQYTLDSLKLLFEPHNLALWSPALALAFGLHLVNRRWQHQLVFPTYFLVIPVVFYIVVAIGRFDIPTLRRTGWLFDMGDTNEPWYHFYAYFDFRRTNWSLIWTTMPTQLALLFFNVLHPPLNVPALAVSLDQDVDTNRELIAHGYSNLLAGLIGSVPNYLVYVNTLLFYRVGGGTRFAGLLLAVATGLLLIVGTAPIGFIPVMVVGALIFVLGMDLVKEALWDTRNRASRYEYITIISIMVCMTLWDFVIGVLFGIVVSCVFFVVQNSQARSIRGMYTGESTISTVRRPGAQRAYIREVAKQTFIMKLQGHLFFGTITQVEGRIRHLLDESSWRHNPVRFVVLDLSLVAGVDLSAAEAFVRVQRLLADRRVIFVLCGFALESEIGKALENVDLFHQDSVELFSNINDALEWTENAYLRAWLSNRRNEYPYRDPFPGRQDNTLQWAESMGSSPRRAQLRDAGGRIFSSADTSPAETDYFHGEPFETLLRAFSSHGPLDPVVFSPLIPYFTRIVVPEGEVIWRQDEPSDALYLIQSGVLRASYHFATSSDIDESMVAGTLAGELSSISGMARNATVIVERDAILWRLGMDDLQRLEHENPNLARAFIKLILKSAKVDYDILIASLAARQ